MAPADAAPGVEDLEAALRPAWVDVDLEALEHNLATVHPVFLGETTSFRNLDRHGLDSAAPF